MNLEVEEDGSSFRARGSFSATHGDFGLDPFKAAMGTLRNDPALQFFLDVRGHSS